MFNFVLCDDNIDTLNKLSYMFETIFIKNNLKAQIAFKSTKDSEILKYVNQNRFDAIVLDISLHGKLTGLQIAEKIRILRIQQGKTQQAVADGIHVSLRTYVSYEQEGRYPRNREIYDRMAAYFGVEKNYLMAEDESFVTQASEQFGSRGKQQAEALVAELTGLFAGGELSENDRDAVMIALQKAYFDCKEDNQKYVSSSRRKKEE
mgnify:CR=1 FL=1